MPSIRLKLASKRKKIAILKAFQSSTKFTYEIQPIGLASEHTWSYRNHTLIELKDLKFEDKSFLKDFCEKIKSQS